MSSKINQILNDIRKKKEDLLVEYENLKLKYGFVIEKWKIIFNSETKAKNRLLKKSILESIFSARVREVLSVPFIYAMIIPSVFLHIFLWIYQQTALRLYGIPLVKIKDYIVFDRKELDYLNVIQKFNCMYCSYVNWLYSYWVEIAGRTEKYWCPIKHAKKMKGWHDWQEYFADYGSPEDFKKCFTNTKEFYKKEEQN